jgi:hypothetical protein
MKMQHISIALTAINLVLMTFLWAQMRPVKAQQLQNSSSVLRGTGLEIVDNLGKVRASITVLPPVEMNGVKYTQSVILRLVDSKGKPLVKMGAAEDGSGLNLLDGSDDGIVINARKAGSSVKITNQGKEKFIAP